MIDLHCHLLPGIDDGPKSMVESVSMAKYAVNQGIQRCVVTPHIQPGCYDNDIENVGRIYAAFREQLESQGIALQVGMAAEVRVCGEQPQNSSYNRKSPFLEVGITNRSSTWNFRTIIFPLAQKNWYNDRLPAILFH